MNHFAGEKSSGESGFRPSETAGRELGSVAVPDLVPDALPEVFSSVYVFRIFSDWRGQFWWRLTDPDGRDVRQSAFSFAAVSGAWRDAVAARRSDARLAEAVIRDDYA